MHANRVHNIYNSLLLDPLAFMVFYDNWEEYKGRDTYQFRYRLMLDYR